MKDSMDKNNVALIYDIIDKFSAKETIDGIDYMTNAICQFTSCKRLTLGYIDKKQKDKVVFFSHRNMEDVICKIRQKKCEKMGEGFISLSMFPPYIRDNIYAKRVTIKENIIEDIENEFVKKILIEEDIDYLYIVPLISLDTVNGFITFIYPKGKRPTDTEKQIFKIVSVFIAQLLDIKALNIDIDLIIDKLREAIISIEKLSHNLYENRGMEVFLKAISKDLCTITKSSGALVLVNDKKYDINSIESYGDNRLLAKCLGFVKKNEGNKKRIFRKEDLPSHLTNLGITSIIYENLVQGGENIGCILAYNSPRYYNDDIRIFGIFSTQIVFALYVYVNNKRMLETSIVDRDLELISNQQKLISDDELIQSDEVIEVDYLNIPYRYVGGDFCKFQKIDEKKYFLFIADVMGHGIISNYFVAMLKGALNTLLNITSSPSSIMNRLNRVLFKELDKLNIFITAKALMFDLENNRLYSSNAGHTLPIAIYKEEDGAIKHEIIHTQSALAFGILEDYIYQEEVKCIKNLDLFAIYTDGIIEMKNEQGEEFGTERLVEYLKSRSAKSQTQNISKNLVTHLKHHIGKTKIEDDITIVTVKIK